MPGLCLVVAGALLIACSGEDRAAPDPTTLVLGKPEANSGDNQVGVAGVRLPDSLRVVVTRDDEPVAGIPIVWFTTEGIVNPTRSVTDAEGMTATTWAPMDLFAEQFMAARIDLEGGATTGFVAIATPDPSAPNTVLVGANGGNTFEPANLTIPAGGAVNWFWPEGSTGHNIVADNGESPPSSGALADWPTWHVFRFTVPGVYRYYCAAHGGLGGVGMAGTITVEEVAGE